MPNYTYQNTETGEVVELSMTISEMVEFEKTNTTMERVYSKVSIADPTNIGITKPSNDFQKYVLGKIKAKTPGATAIGNKRWTIPKEI
jgi:hypothetical protein